MIASCQPSYHIDLGSGPSAGQDLQVSDDNPEIEAPAFSWAEEDDIGFMARA